MEKAKLICKPGRRKVVHLLWQCQEVSILLFCLFVLLLVPVVKNTIGQHTSRIVYYSETVDSSIPTEDTGVPNTESGNVRCYKQ